MAGRNPLTVADEVGTDQSIAVGLGNSVQRLANQEVDAAVVQASLQHLSSEQRALSKPTEGAGAEEKKRRREEEPMPGP